MEKLTRKIQFGIMGAVFLLQIWLMRDLIRLDPILSYDDELLLDPIRSVSSFAEYWDWWLRGRIADLQPIRDLSFAIDFWVERAIGHSVHHAINLLVWFGILIQAFFLAEKIYGADEPNRKRLAHGALCVFLMLAFLPTLANAPAWISARKHLLSAFFVLGASRAWLSFLDSKRQSFFSLSKFLQAMGLYLLACYSQPLAAGWPALALGLAYLRGVPLFAPRHKRDRWIVGVLGVLTLFVILPQWYYYNGLYLEISGGIEKFSADLVEDKKGFQLLAVGRYFFQTLIPLSPNITDHYPGSMENVIGLVLIPVVYFLFYKFRPEGRPVWTDVLFLGFFLALAPVLVSVTNVFAMDTYLPHAATLFWIWAFSKPVSEKFQKILVAGCLVLAICYSFLWTRQTKAWMDGDTLWQVAYEQEKTPFNAVQHASRLVTTDTDRAFALIEQVREWAPDQSYLPGVYALIVTRLPNISVDQKLRMIRQTQLQSPALQYFIAALHAQKGDYAAADDLMKATFTDNPKAFHAMLSPGYELIAAEWQSFCGWAKRPDCPKRTEILRKDLIQRPWKPEVFQKRLDALNKIE